MMTLILFILIFGVVVLSHEFGHFLIAKLNGIHVVEFSVGMGPKLFSFQKKETTYALRLLPLGGACMFEGEDGLETEEETKEKGADAAAENGRDASEGSFPGANVWARIATVLAGPIFNFILAFFVAMIVVSIQAPADNVLSGVAEGSPAEEAGLMAGDKILRINGNRTPLFEDIYLQVYLNGGNTMQVQYERNKESYTVELTPVYSEENGGYLMGIYGRSAAESSLNLFQNAWYEMRYGVVNTYKSLGLLISGKLSRQDVSGPVGIAVNVVGKTYQTAKSYGVESVVYSMLSIVLLLSVNLGILNLLPLPALDGGRLVFLLIEVVRGKPVPPDKEGIVHFIGMVFFMVLMVVVLFNDISNIFHGV